MRLHDDFCLASFEGEIALPFPVPRSRRLPALVANIATIGFVPASFNSPIRSRMRKSLRVFQVFLRLVLPSIFIPSSPPLSLPVHSASPTSGRWPPQPYRLEAF